MIKVCTICKIDKPLAEFGKNSRIKDGYHYTCKKCKKEQGKVYRKENKDKIKKSSAQYYLEKKDKILDKSKKWKENNKEYLSQKRKEDYETNKEIELAKQKEYRKNNRIKLNAKAAYERAARK